MLFNSYEFIVGFLPICLLIYFSFSQRLGLERALGLLAFGSLAFYSYWNPAYLPLILSSVAVNFWLGTKLKDPNITDARTRRSYLLAGVVFDLGLLGYFKYANFAVDTWNYLSGSNVELARIALPLAISFFTFQQLGYVLQAYYGLQSQPTLVRYGFVVTFFPHLIAGPIVLHQEFFPQLKSSILKFNKESFAVGATLFVFGLFKKVVIADNIARFSSPIFDALPQGIQPTTASAWLAVFAYSLQLYFDFSGYSDMAVGLARLFNLKLPANFESPYKAANVGEFWRRWHVTLSRFLRQYLYVPLGGNRGSSLRVSFNLFLTMLLGGMWHGAGWGFIIWGAVNGVFLVLHRLYVMAWRKRHPGERPARASGLKLELGITFTFFLVMMSRVSFRAPDWDSSMIMYRSLLGLVNVDQVVEPSFSLMRGTILSLGAYLICRVMPNTQEMLADYDPLPEPVSPSWIRFRLTTPWALVVAVALIIALLNFGEVSEFLYFQF